MEMNLLKAHMNELASMVSITVITFITVINNMTKKFNIYPVKYRFKKAAVNCLDLQMIVKMATCHPIPIITFSLLLYVIYS